MVETPHDELVGHDTAYNVKGTDVMSYNQHFQELVLMCDRMFPEESNVVEKNRPAAANNNQRSQETNQRVLTCYECGAQGHFKSDCPKLKNGNQWNRARDNRCRIEVIVSTAFSSLINISFPNTLRPCYDVELADANHYCLPIPLHLILGVYNRMVPEPRRYKKKVVRKIVEKLCAKAIETYEKTRADSNNIGGSGSTNTGGTVVPEMHGCSYNTFMNGKLHSFKD
ncbi:putative reverse transcriptase domain-containing protein [Tanacetum coccineum]